MGEAAMADAAQRGSSDILKFDFQPAARLGGDRGYDRARSDETKRERASPAALATPSVVPAAEAPRVVSVDALRGFNMLLIIGADGAVGALVAMVHDKGPVLGALGNFLGMQFTHVVWEGLTFYDFIFPLFVFITGVSIALALPGLVAREGKAAAHWRVLRRALILYGLGLLFYGGVGEHFSDIRYVGVLQRIAASYLGASLLFLNFNRRVLVGACVALLAGYWALMTFVPVPGIGAGLFAPDANLATWIDVHYLPGRLWFGTGDAEGLLCSLPAIGGCLIGVLAGLVLREARLTPQQKSLTLAAAGVVLVLAGHLWAVQFPIIKTIWTSSFVLVTSGYAALLLAAFYQIIDVWGYRRWSTFLIWIGANAITLYMINGTYGFEPFARRMVGGDVSRLFDQAVTPGTGSLVAHVLGLALAVALAGFLYRRKIFIRV